MKKVNFPAQFIVRNGDEITHLCQKHLQREISEETKVESISEIGYVQCSECVNDRIND